MGFRQIVYTEGKEDAIAIFLENIGFVRCVAFETAPSKDLVGDIVNDCFIEFVDKSECWDMESDIKPLLRKMVQLIARRYWKDRLKDLTPAFQKLAEHLQKRLEVSDDEPVSRVSEQEQSLLEECIQKLPAHLQELIRAHYFEKIPLVQIAKETNRKVDVLYNAISRVRVTLKRCIAKHTSSEQSHGE